MLLKSNLLSSVRMFYDAEKEGGVEKTPAELRTEQRKKIEVTTVKPTEQPEVEKEEDDETEKDGQPSETEAEEIAEGNERVEEHKKTEEELETEKAEAKSVKEKERIQKRIDKEVGKRKTLEAENAELKRKLAAKPDDEKVLTEDDVEARAEIKAEEKALQRQFANDCDKLFKEATKIDKNFKAKIDSLTEDAGKIEGLMIGVLADLANGGDILNYFVNEPEEYERLNGLASENVVKMGIELDRISNKLITKNKQPKPISKVPPPNEPLNGSRQTTNEITQADTKNMDEYVRKRMIQKEESRKARIR